MTSKEIIDSAIAYANTTKSSVARNMGYSRQQLNQRINTGKFTPDEWNELAIAIGGKSAEIHIYFEDGHII